MQRMQVSSDEAKKREAALLDQLSDSRREAAAHAAAHADTMRKLDEAAELHVKEVDRHQKVCTCLCVCVCMRAYVRLSPAFSLSQYLSPCMCVFVGFLCFWVCVLVCVHSTHRV